MIPVTGHILQALEFFKFPIVVKDAQYERDTDGIDKQVVKTRTIRTAVDPSGGRNLGIEFGGSVSDGDIALVTECELYIDDNYSEGSRSRQSFVLYDGVNYRIAERSSWMPQAGVYAYRASRHVTQDII